MLKTDQLVPNFEAEATDGPFALSAHKDRVLVIYFYPRDNTPGCTQEGTEFAHLHDQFLKCGVRVYGLSRDSLKSHQKFKEKMGYPFDLIADPQESVCALFGVMKDKNMYGKKVRGIERSTFVIDTQGRLIQAWRGVKVPGHAQEVLDFVRSPNAIKNT